ncbi:FAD-dependent oxidoreductase [Pseudalkalibacillus caeni]|uniref:FAD-dependent oxidoreductase n=1 Tax=Exobacillus caeni TaxID=2574798 RepID=A0A5R9F8Y2_9BACL|nr:FAD-dependent oxidoreductase [Pseudalkalibacillus caeni]
MPENLTSYWLDSVELPSFDPLTADIKTDTVVIGAGITGITTAYLLSRQGLKVTVLDAGNILDGTTGRTTAKLTAQHGLIYDHLIKEFGEEKAKQYYQSNQDAIEFVRQLVVDLNIDCDLAEEDAYIFAETEEDKLKIDKEVQAYEKLGIDGGFVDSLPLDIETKGAVVMRNQAQFHPVKYLKRLVDEIVAAGGQVFENTRVMDIEKGDRPSAITESGHKVTGENIAVCSHFPFYDKEGFYFARMRPKRSYSLAVKPKENFPGGMYISASKPKHSLRYTSLDGEQLVIVGGQGHPTGHKSNTDENYEKLYEFGDKVFGIEDVPYRWSSQDPETLDKVPFIGKYSKDDDNIFVGTGYRKWGMSNGTLAGMLLHDWILHFDNPYSDLYSPDRPHQGHNVKKFVKENTHVAKRFVKDLVDLSEKTVDDLGYDEGAIVSLGGKKAAAYKDKDGELHVVNSACTHFGCDVKWNCSERSWDCPCHGSRFYYNGEVLEGPAVKPLDQIDPDKKQ